MKAPGSYLEARTASPTIRKSSQRGDPRAMSTAVAGKGLEGIVAANSGICWIDGETGVLSYRGIDIHELAVHSTFEETTYLLWNGILPNQFALRDFQSQLSMARGLDFRIVDMLRGIPASATPMEVLRTAVSALSFYDADEKDNSHDANVRKCYHLTAQMAMIVAIYDRLRKGLEIVPPDRSLNHAANFLWMLNGVKPSETAVKTMDMALVLHAEHELNASTFAARVIAATLADVHSAITGAIGALGCGGLMRSTAASHSCLTASDLFIANLQNTRLPSSSMSCGRRFRQTAINGPRSGRIGWAAASVTGCLSTKSGLILSRTFQIYQAVRYRASSRPQKERHYSKVVG